MNRLANLALSVGETLVHEAGRLLFGIAIGRAKELLGTLEPLGTRQLALMGCCDVGRRRTRGHDSRDRGYQLPKIHWVDS